jgi:predicted DNA-binding transcriptional regulator YafY
VRKFFGLFQKKLKAVCDEGEKGIDPVSKLCDHMHTHLFQEDCMARGDQIGRQWRIIQILISSRKGKSASDLAFELDCRPRTIYRDLHALEVAGFPIYTETVAGTNLWSVLDTVKRQTPIPFTLPELMALHFSARMLHVFKGAVFYDAIESLSHKIRSTLPPESLNYVKKMHQTLDVGIRPYKEYGRVSEIIGQVQDAAMNRKTIEMVHYSMGRKEETRRKVDPYRVWFFNGAFYLIGHCHKRKEVRIFALDRIRSLRQTGDEFDIPKDFDFDAFIQPSFGVYQGTPVAIKVWFHPDVAGYIEEKVWHESQKIHRQIDGSIIFEARAGGTDEIKYWVMSWGARARVLEPESLRQEIRAEAEGMLKGYAGI